ncbi:MAG: N-acetyltransferase [Acidimicrobiia bacterium]
MTVPAIEAAAAAAWPATESTTLGSWTLLAGDGFSRRRNSAVPAGPVPDDLERRLDDVAEWYRVRALPTIFRITPLCAPMIDDELAKAGYAVEAPTLVMHRRTERGDAIPGVLESPVATDDWISAELDALGIDPSQVGPWLATLAKVPGPAAFVSATVAGRPVGAGLGVVVGDHLGVFEVVVDPSHRRQGHATRIMDSLHAFGARGGASTAFLQVLEDDERAIALYRSLGYEVSHRYWYRRSKP